MSQITEPLNIKYIILCNFFYSLFNPSSIFTLPAGCVSNVVSLIIGNRFSISSGAFLSPKEVMLLTPVAWIVWMVSSQFTAGTM
jgi:hypothetical protein